MEPDSNAVPLIYAVPADLGSGAAHRVHVVKMTTALRRIGLGVDLCVRAAPSDDTLMTDFELRETLDAIRIGDRYWGPDSLRFALGVRAHAKRGQKLLTRNLLTACVGVLSGHMTLLELHSPVESFRSRMLCRFFIRHPRALGMIVITSALKNRYVQDFGRAIAPYIHVLPDAADPVTQRETVQSAADRAGPVVGYVGSFLPGKGAEQVLKIAALMPEVRFVLIGGPVTALAGLSVPPNVQMPGPLPHAVAMQQTASLDVALLPNQARVFVSGGSVDIGRWTSPLKLFEYMAAARPIVASRLPVLEEVLTDDRNALLADPASPNDWVDKIRRILDEPALAERLSKAAHSDFQNNYSWTARAERTADILGLKVVS